MAETVSDGEGLADPKEDPGTDEAAIAHRWKLELDAARKGPYKRWLAQAKRSIRRFRDEDVDSEDGGIRKRNAQFNVLWSNINTVAPSIYSRAPKPVAERRYLDRDVVARAAATILQRSLTYQIEESQLHETMMQCRTDYSLVGIGSVWLRFEGKYEQTAPQHQAPIGGQPYAGAATEKVTYQKICADYCHWSDDLISACRFWAERTWRGKRAYYSRKQLMKLCNKAAWVKEIPLKVTRGKKENDVGDQVREVIGKAEVWQIWDIEEREVIWLCEDYLTRPLKHLKKGEDELNLNGFIPSPMPVRATTTNDSFWPIPDYAIWRDQAAELDNLTARIAALTRAIKAVGVFDASQPELERMLMEGSENKLYGVKNWAKLVQRGGLEGSVGLLPIKEMADALTALYLARAQVKNDLYEISGVSDIVRGASDPKETAAAQKMKGQFSSVRTSDRKNEFNRFVRDTLVLMAEIMLEHFTDETLWLMCDFEQWAKDQDLRSYAENPMIGHNGGPPMPLDAPAPPMPGLPPAASPVQGLLPPQDPAAQLPVGAQGPAAAPPGAMPAPVPGIAAAPVSPAPPPPPPIDARGLFNEALLLLRNDRLRSFRIQVETDSTIEPDATQEKADRVEFLGAVTQFLAQAQEMAAAFPMVIPVMGKMLLWGVRGFKAGRELESSLESLVTDLEAQARNPGPKKPSPEEIKAGAEKQKADAAIAKSQLDAQNDQQRMQMEMEKIKLELEAEKAKLELEMEALKIKTELEIQMLQMKMQAQQQDLEIKRETAQIDGAVAQQKAQLDMQTAEAQAQADAEQREGESQARREEMDIQREGLGIQREGLDIKRQQQKDKAAADKKKAETPAKAPTKKTIKVLRGSDGEMTGVETVEG